MVAQVYRDQIVPPSRHRQRLLEPGSLEVRHEEHDRATLDHAGQIFERAANIRPTSLGLMVEELPEHPKHMGPAFSGGDELFDAIAENDQADLVVVLDGRERQQGADLHRHLALHALARPKISRRAHVHDQHDRELALFFEHLDEGAPRASRHVPVDAADIVAVLVLPHLGEIHPTSLEDGVVFT